MKKRLTLLFHTFILFFILMSTNVFASDTSKYDTTQKIEYEKGNIKVFGKYPLIKGLKNSTFEKNINKEIETLVNNISYDKNDNTFKSFAINYDIVLSKNNLSIILYFKNTVTSDIQVKTIVIDINKSTKISINDFLGANGLNFVNKVVASKISEMNLTAKKITETSPFYIQNNNINIIFPAGEITFPQRGNIILEIKSANINNYTVNKNLYYTKSNYNVKMIPLRPALEHFGYRLVWNNKNNSITIYKGSNFTSYIKINENKYSKSNKFLRPLEFAPEFKKGITYVPISFFGDILDLLYTVDKNNNVVISNYAI